MDSQPAVVRSAGLRRAFRGGRPINRARPGADGAPNVGGVEAISFMRPALPFSRMTDVGTTAEESMVCTTCMELMFVKSYALLTSGTAAQFQLLGSTKRSRCFVPTCYQDRLVRRAGARTAEGDRL